jgi:CBS domain-containing protein
MSLIVREDECLADVLRRFSEESWLRGIFVTDAEGRFCGVITRTDMVHWARLRLGTALRSVAGIGENMLRLATLVQADRAADAIHPNSQTAKVSLSDPLDLALQIMIRTDLVDIPIVDDDQRIVGDLLFSDVLRYLLRQHRDVC